ncbi:hypothetical protein [Pantoea stewartii]|uniref:hypothetical protein n=1 Tax=Pantoea stewartii TaxID=66269 RepID=UPI00197E3032|nr:hypothetical protein [Pantoea stewartii]
MFPVGIDVSKDTLVAAHIQHERKPLHLVVHGIFHAALRCTERVQGRTRTDNQKQDEQPKARGKTR